MLGEKAGANPPVKCTKARNGAPVEANFVFVPKAFPQLKENVRWVRWDAAKKTVMLELTETPKFDVYRWVEYTNKQNHDLEKSPFVDIDINSATLTFLDGGKVPVATVKFKTLTIDHHACVLNAKQSYPGEVSESMSHELRFTYADSELTVHSTDQPEPHDICKYPGMAGATYKGQDELKDGEWQTVETPA